MPHSNPYSAPQTIHTIPLAEVASGLTPEQLLERRAINLNGWLWAIGNLLTTGPFILFLATDLGARGFGLSLLLALPSLAGMMRLAAPWIHAWARNAKRFYLLMTIPSYILISFLPAIDLRQKQWPEGLLIALVVLILVHQMLEYLGQVAQWHWFGDLIPADERGKFFGRRQALQIAFMIPVGLLLAFFLDIVRKGGISWLTVPRAYAVAHGIGAFFLLSSIVPLISLRAPAPIDLEENRSSRIRSTAGALTALADQSYWRFLIFRIWFSLANGISQSSQFIYTSQILGLVTLPQTIFKVLMQVGQIAISFLIGPHCDRFGYRTMLIIAQVLVTLGLGVFLVVRPDWGVNPWWLIVGWILWSAYAVHNLAFPNIALSFAPREYRSGYIASADALANLAHGLMTIVGGAMYDWLVRSGFTDFSTDVKLSSAIFVLGIGFVGRFIAVLLATLIREPRLTYDVDAF